MSKKTEPKPKVDPEKVLERARVEGDKFLAAVDWTGNYDTEAVRVSLSKRVHKGEPVLAIVVSDPSEVGAACLRGACELEGLTTEPPDIAGLSQQAKEALSQAHQCLWDLYLMAFYSSAYVAADMENPHEFGAQSFLEPVQLGLWAIVNLGPLVVGITRPLAFREGTVLHNPAGPAIKWGTWEKWFWRGTEVPREWIEDTENQDPSIGFTHTNIEQRRAFCEIVGWDKILRDREYTLIEKDDDPQIGTLFDVDIPGNGMQRFLRVECGTGRTFCLPVPNDMKTARQANAWTYQLEEGEYRPEVRT